MRLIKKSPVTIVSSLPTVSEKSGHSARTVRLPGRLSRNLLRLLTAVFLLASIIALRAQTETVITNASNWKYRKGTTEATTPISAWRTNGFNDSGWTTGAAPFSYGEGLSSGTFFNDIVAFFYEKLLW